MTSMIMLYVGSIAITLWGIAHVAPTRPVVEGFGALSVDNRRIITMEWIAEGLTLSFIGLLTLLVTALGWSQTAVAVFIYRVSAVMLIVMAGLSWMTGARTSTLPMKVCPYVKTAAAILLLLGSA